MTTPAPSGKEPSDGQDPEVLLRRLYGVLRSIARDTMAGERVDHTLQPTALLHEAWVRVFHTGAVPDVDFRDREHVIRLLSRTMRRVLVDHARARGTVKRRANGKPVGLDEAVMEFAAGGTGLVEFDDALCVLAETDSELARIVELRVFGGLSMGEVASAVEVSLATAERRWRVARLWMLEALGEA